MAESLVVPTPLASDTKRDSVFPTVSAQDSPRLDYMTPVERVCQLSVSSRPLPGNETRVILMDRRSPRRVLVEHPPRLQSLRTEKHPLRYPASMQVSLAELSSSLSWSLWYTLQPHSVVE